MKKALCLAKLQASRAVHFPMNFMARRLEGKSQGQALIYVTIMMMTLLAFAALVVDGGMIFMNRRQMQNAVDAAALAGAQNLPLGPNDPLGARPVACDYAMSTDKNFVSDMTVDCSDQAPSGSEACNANPSVDILVCQTYIPNDTVRVTAHKTFDPLFGAGLGWTSINIRTQAAAVLGSIHSACVAPFFQTQDLLEASGVWDGSGVELNRATIMKTSSGDANSGNFLALELPGGGGANAWSDAIASTSRCQGDDAPQTSGTAETKTGNMVGPFDSGMKRRKDSWVAQGNCPSTNARDYLDEETGRLWNGELELTPSTCYRMIVIPLLAGTSTDYNGHTTAGVRGFLTFYISNWCGQSSTPKKGSGSDAQHCAAPSENPSLGQLGNGELWGYYVGFLAAGEDIQAYDGFGTKVVLLIA
jgi:hypothetical protein